MAGDTAAALVIELSAKVDTFRNEMRKATGVFDQEGRKIERRQAQLRKNIETSFGGMGRNLAGAASAGALFAFGRRLLDIADNLSDTSQQLGITTQELQGLDYGARVSGASSEKLAQALAFLADGLGEAERGEGALAEAMRRNGVQMGTTVEVLYDVADRVKAARTETEKMNIATTYLGAKAGKGMVSFLNQGADGLRRLQAEASAKGQIWDAETLKRLDDAKDAFETLQKAAINLAALPASEFMTSLAHILELLAGGDVKQGLDGLKKMSLAPLGAVAGGMVGGPVGAVVGGLAGAAAGHAAYRDPKKLDLYKGPYNFGSAGKRTGVPNSAAQNAKLAADAAQALEDARRVSDILAQLREDAARTADDAAEASRDVVRSQNDALLQQAQGWSNFAEIQRAVIGDNARLDIQSIEERRDADLRALEIRRVAEMDQLKEHRATLAQMAEADAAYERQRVSIADQASQEIKIIRQKEAADIEQIRTREVELNDEARRGLIEIGLAARHGFGDMKDAALRALDAVIDLVLQLYVLEPLLDSIGLKAGGGGGGLFGGGGGGLFGSLLGGLFGGGGGGMDFGFGASFFAKGGVMTPNGRRRLPRFSKGGRSNGPAIFGEAGPEAAIPLPDGRTVPVTLSLPDMPAGARAAGGGVTIVQQFDLSGAVVTDELYARMEGAARTEAQKAVATYDRNHLPGRVRTLNADPRRNF